MRMHAKYEVAISYGSKLIIANVKVDNRQDKNNMPRIIRSGGWGGGVGDKNMEQELEVNL